jgi:hypothetical protein
LRRAPGTFFLYHFLYTLLTFFYNIDYVYVHHHHLGTRQHQPRRCDISYLINHSKRSMGSRLALGTFFFFYHSIFYFTNILLQCRLRVRPPPPSWHTAIPAATTQHILSYHPQPTTTISPSWHTAIPDNNNITTNGPSHNNHENDRTQ